MTPRSLTRRRFLEAAMAGGAGLALTSSAGRLIERAAAAEAPCGSIGDIEHVVIVMQENRSFDQFFGTYPGVAGFSDPRVLKLQGRPCPIWPRTDWDPGASPPVAADYRFPFTSATAKTAAAAPPVATYPC